MFIGVLTDFYSIPKDLMMIVHSLPTTTTLDQMTNGWPFYPMIGLYSRIFGPFKDIHVDL